MSTMPAAPPAAENSEFPSKSRAQQALLHAHAYLDKNPLDHPWEAFEMLAAAWREVCK